MTALLPVTKKHLIPNQIEQLADVNFRYRNRQLRRFSLSIYPELQFEQMEYVVETIMKFFEAS